MGRITTGVGLISGINSGSIIDQLIQLESRPITQLQTRIDTANQHKLAFADLMTRLTSLNLNATALTKPATQATNPLPNPRNMAYSAVAQDTAELLLATGALVKVVGDFLKDREQLKVKKLGGALP